MIDCAFPVTAVVPAVASSPTQTFAAGRQSPGPNPPYPQYCHFAESPADTGAAWRLRHSRSEAMFAAAVGVLLPPGGATGRRQGALGGHCNPATNPASRTHIATLRHIPLRRYTAPEGAATRVSAPRIVGVTVPSSGAVGTRRTGERSV
jgi:hypothetical protein